MAEHFGSTQSEEDLDKILQCRDIVKTILNFGVSQTQILLLIQFLGQELERHEHMVEVVELARELLKQEEQGLLVDRVETNG